MNVSFIWRVLSERSHCVHILYVCDNVQCNVWECVIYSMMYVLMIM